MFHTRIAPDEVFATLRKHMLIDGFDIVVDLEKSRGSRIVDARNGRSYIDFFTFFASMPLGCNHPKLDNDETIRRLGRAALNKPTLSDVYTVEMAEFVETLSRVAIPPYMKYAFFVEGGAVAVENALKAAFDWKVRKNLARGFTPEKGYPDGKGHKILHFHHCFHGRTGYTLSLTESPDPRKTQYFPKFDWPRITAPAAVFPLEGKNLENTVALENKAVAEILDALQRHPHDIAALIVEPIQGEGGDNHFRPEFHKELRRLADEHEFLLIHDEVQTGFGLTGRMWGHEDLGVRPDILSFGKKSQVCGILAGPRLDEIPDHVFKVSSRINSTWGGNLTDMVRCRLYLEVIEEENLLENVRVQGAHLLSELQTMEQEFEGAVSNARGRGLFCAFDLDARLDRGAFLAEAYRQGLMILACGTRSVRFRPALSIDRPALDEGLGKVRAALKSVWRPQATGV